jgi:hypothetical protein
MWSIRTLIVGLAAVALSTLAGCACHKHQTSYTASAPPCNTCGPVVGPPPGRFFGARPLPSAPPGAFVPADPQPQPPVYPTPGSETPPTAAPVPTTPPITVPPTRSPEIPPAPAPPSASIGTPELPPVTQRFGTPGPTDPIRRESASVPPSVPRDTAEPPVASVPSKPAPTVTEERDALIDLPDYAVAFPGVATGVKPLPEGFDWLKAHGYKAVLHLVAPGEDNSAARRLVESKGLNYISLVVSPARLTPEISAEFNRIVNDKGKGPLYVFDFKGAVAGGMWYLYFRRQPGVTPEKALEEARRLGLKSETSPDPEVAGEAKAMWLAIQKILEKP